MVARISSPRIAERPAAKSVATVRSALVPGIDPARLERRVPAQEAVGHRRRIAMPPNASRQAAASRRTASAARGRIFARCACRRSRRGTSNRRRASTSFGRFAARAPRQAPEADRENVFIGRDILPRDAIPVRRLRHGLAQRDRAGRVHVVPGRASEAAGVGGGDGGEDVAASARSRPSSTAASAGRSAASARFSTAAASGAHSRTMPRLVFWPTADSVAATAPRTRTPTRAPLVAMGAALASALTTKSVTLMRWPGAKRCTLPGFSASSSARQASM